MKSCALVTVLALSLPVTATESIVNIPVACIRQEPRHASQLISQATMGTPLEVTDTIDGWMKVTTPDGYQGYITTASIIDLDGDEWRHSPRLIVTSPDGCVITNDGEIVVRLPLNAIVEAGPDGNVLLPDGRQGQPRDASSLRDFSQWASQVYGGRDIVDTARQLMGAPYLWGGASSSAMDCSGLVSLCYFHCGKIMRRDAWMQAEDSAPLQKPEQPGDLIFFDRDYNGTIDHVAIYDADGRYIHCSGQVKINAVSPECGDTISGRIVGYGRPEPITVAEHPAYF